MSRRATGGVESLGTSSPEAAGPRQNPAQTRTESGDSGPRDLLGVKVKQLRGPGGARRRRSSTAAAERGALHGGARRGGARLGFVGNGGCGGEVERR